MSLSAEDDRKHFFKTLNNHIAKKTTATGVDYVGMLKILSHTKKFIEHAFKAERTDAEQREALAVNLNWFINQLLYFAVNDTEKT